MELESVTIENFKSIKKIVLPLNQLTILIGPNSSGKTNVIEFFKFIQIALLTGSLEQIQANWWKYSNLIKDYDPNAKVKGVFRFKLKDSILTFTAKVSFVRQKIEVEQIVHCKDAFTFARDTTTLKEKFEISNTLLTEIQPSISKWDTEDPTELFKSLELNKNRGLVFQFTPTLNFYLEVGSVTHASGVHLIKVRSRNKNYYQAEPGTFEKVIMLIQNSARGLNHFFSNFAFLSQLNFSKIRNTFSDSPKITILNENGSNLFPMIFRWFYTNSNKWHSLIDSILIEYPGSTLQFGDTSDGKKFLVLKERSGIELEPPNFSDGFLKLLVVLAAMRTEPSLLLIDEVENSLYREALELVFDEIKSNGLNVLLTTHSPHLVDLTTLDNLVLISKPGTETLVLKPKNIEKLKERLTELNLSHSDAWQSGALEEV